MRSTKCGPASGETNVRLRWSEISAPVPGGQSVRSPPLALREDSDPGAGRGRDPDRVRDRRRPVALVQVGPAEVGQDGEAVQVVGPDQAAVPGGDGSEEARQLGDRQLGDQ